MSEFLQGDYGDITKRVQLRQHLQCHDFEWFIQNVYPDVFNPKSVAAEGEVEFLNITFLQL